MPTKNWMRNVVNLYQCTCRILPKKQVKCTSLFENEHFQFGGSEMFDILSGPLFLFLTRSLILLSGPISCFCIFGLF